MDTSTARLSDITIRVGEALSAYGHLPLYGVTIYTDNDIKLRLPALFMGGRTALHELAQWADEFDTPIIISLSSFGSGDVETTIELVGIPATVNVAIGTAQAYELGAALQRPLSRDVSITLSAAELTAVLPEVSA